MWATIKRNWKTSLAGLCAFLTSVPGFISALTAWGQGQPVQWRQVLVSVGLAGIGAGLAMAKDGDNHSTVAEVEAATVAKPLVSASATPAPPTQVKG